MNKAEIKTAKKVLQHLASCPTTLVPIDTGHGKHAQTRYSFCRIGRQKDGSLTPEGEDTLDRVFELIATAPAIIDCYPESYLKGKGRDLNWYSTPFESGSRQVKGFLEDLYKDWLRYSPNCLLYLKSEAPNGSRVVEAFSLILPLTDLGRMVIESKGGSALDLRNARHFARTHKKTNGLLLDMFALRSGTPNGWRESVQDFASQAISVIWPRGSLPRQAARANYHYTMILRHLSDFLPEGKSDSWPDLLIEPDDAKFIAFCNVLKESRTDREDEEGKLSLGSYVLSRNVALGWPNGVVDASIAPLKSLMDKVRINMVEVSKIPISVP